MTVYYGYTKQKFKYMRYSKPTTVFVVGSLEKTLLTTRKTMITTAPPLI